MWDSKRAASWIGGVVFGVGACTAGVNDYGNYYNGIILGNLTTTGGDTEGRLLVTGNASFNVGYSVGIPVIGAARTLTPSIDDLVVGGNLTTATSVPGTVPTLVALNAVAYGGTFSGNPIDAGGAIVAIAGLQLNPADGNAVASGGDSMAAVVSGFQSDSLAMAALAERGVVSKVSEFGTTTLIGNDTELNIFTISSTDWVAGHTRVVNVPAGAEVLINILGSSISYSGGTFEVQGTDRGNVVYNYPEATTFASASTLHEGAILAPFTTTVNLNGGAVNGLGVFGGNVSQINGWEFHNFTFTGITSLPEPSTFVSGFGVLVALGWCCQRRNQGSRRDQSPSSQCARAPKGQ